ncbi:hypothetical protein DFH28DRAFT_907839 [Melampsora americana]|nr:hypothetical protein DFH28DRAFT_907839 [Melampsora americana]
MYVLVKWLLSREKTAQRTFLESHTKLNVLYRKPNYTEGYLLGQWTRQREQQLRELPVENSSTLASKLSKLVGLEEDLREAEDEHTCLRGMRRRDRTPVEVTELAQLPERTALLNEKIDKLVAELGGNEYQNTPGARNNNPDSISNTWMINIVGSVRPRALDKLIESKESGRAVWQEVTQARILEAEPLDKGEAEEEQSGDGEGEVAEVDVDWGEEGEVQGEVQGEMDVD